MPRSILTRPATRTLVTLMLAHAAASAAAPAGPDLAALHRQAGQAMDAAYYEAGRRVDLVIFDLEAVGAQGRPAPREVVRAARNADARLRKGWLALEARRKAVMGSVAEIPPAGRYVLRVDNLETGLGSDAWFGLRSARIEWPDGTSVDLPPKAFANGAFQTGYRYLVEPADAVFAYSRQSSQCLMQAGFDVEHLPHGPATLVFSGVDGDSPGATHIRVSLNGMTLFDGANPCRADVWTRFEIPVPAAAFRRPTPGRSKEAIAADLARLRADAEAFGQEAAAVAADVEWASGPARRGLKIAPLVVPADWWKRQFVRGVCYVPFAQEYVHHMRSFRDLGANMVYSYTGQYNKPTEFPATLAAVRATGLPYFQFTIGLSNGSTDSVHWGEPAELVRNSLAFLESAEGDSGVPVNLSVDEPNFRDTLASNPAVVAAFRRYMATRRPALTKAGIAVPADPVPVLSIAKPEDRPLWMEWQLFKCREMGAQMRALWDGLEARKRVPFVIVQDHQALSPQMASFVSTGRELPWISTDLYNNGSIRQGLSMQLLRNASSGRTVLTAGAGYSDKTADRFRRSLGVAMTHADGVLEWTDIYFTKYRDPKAFWKNATDDQGRDMLANWRPEYWGIAKEMYHRMALADRYLGGGRPLARTAVVYSERTAISDSAESTAGYFANMQGVYSDLVRWGVPLEARFVENLTPEALRRLRVIVLPDARVLTPGECAALRDWVRGGGTLIASGRTSLCDEWGRPMPDYALADVFGASYLGLETGGGSFMMDKRPVAVPRAEAYARVRPTTASVVSAWSSGDPALLSNRFGKGRAWLFTLGNLGRRGEMTSAPNGLLGKGLPGLPEALARMAFPQPEALPIRVEGAPEGVEVQMRRYGAATVVQMLDWFDGRTVTGASVRIGLPGKWRLSYPTGGTPSRVVSGGARIPLRALRIHDVFVLEPAGR